MATQLPRDTKTSSASDQDVPSSPGDEAQDDEGAASTTPEAGNTSILPPDARARRQMLAEAQARGTPT